MQHLKVEEIINFVSLSEYDQEAVALCSVVNEHIRHCQKCLRLTKAFQMIHDEFTRLCVDGDFKVYANAVLTQEESDQAAELHLALELDSGS